MVPVLVKLYTTHDGFCCVDMSVCFTQNNDLLQKPPAQASDTRFVALLLSPVPISVGRHPALQNPARRVQSSAIDDVASPTND